MATRHDDKYPMERFGRIFHAYDDVLRRGGDPANVDHDEATRLARQAVEVLSEELGHWQWVVQVWQKR